jgi:F-type H+-transporting ATPase subunit epsilon
MKLKILLPTAILLEAETEEIVAEAENGSFGLLPNHIDFVTALVPGILSYTTTTGEMVYLAVDQGILIKQGEAVVVSTQKAVQGQDLETLKATVENEFIRLDEGEKKARSALAKLEAGFIRKFVASGGTQP